MSCLMVWATAVAVADSPVRGWPPQVRRATCTSSLDGVSQPLLLYVPENQLPRPLLVALHTWSNGYDQPEPSYAEWCIQHDWIMVRPHFRGPNRHPDACGSDLAVQDILDAVRHAQTTAPVDEDRIYLVGGSGGGHMALLMAARAPDIWAGVSAWCPISDLGAWHAETKAAGRGYWNMIEASCGGPPGASPEVDAQYARRSPVTNLNNAVGVNLDINAGIRDGHTGSVPVSHSLNAFNAVAQPGARFTADTIRALCAEPRLPDALRQPIEDPLYKTHPVLLRRVSNTARITLFDGAHEMMAAPALTWLARQRKGQVPVWNVSGTQPDDPHPTQAIGR